MLRQKKQFVAIFVVLVGIGSFAFSQYAFSSSIGITINGSRTTTDVRKVELKLRGPFDVVDMKISNDPQLAGARWEPYRREKTWYLQYNDENPLGSEHRVYVRYRDAEGNMTDIFSDYIRLEPPAIEAKLKLVDEGPFDTRFIWLDADVSEGIDAYRYGFTSDLSAFEFQTYTGRNFQAVVSAGSGTKTIYVDFKDASGMVVKRSITVVYNQPQRYIEEGSLIKGQGPAIYYYGFGGYLHAFLNADIYNTWYTNFDDINVISDVALQQYKFGAPVCFRQGTYLVKFKELPKVYAVENGCQLRPIRSETEAYLLYGSSWASRIRELDPLYRSLYYELGYDITDDEEDIVDEDGDGLDEEKERDFGSSDFKEDTDNDGISDYEEILYWFSDPADPDSDNDGISDGREIRNGINPLSNQPIKVLPAGTYQYPRGTVVNLNETLYYVDGPTAARRIGSTLSSGFTKNRLRAEFIVKPPITLELSTSYRRLSGADDAIRLPLYTTEKGMIKGL